MLPRRSRTRPCWRPSAARRGLRGAPRTLAAARRSTRRGRHLPGGDRDDPYTGALRCGRRLRRDEESGNFRVARLHVVEPELARPRAEIGDVPAEMAALAPLCRPRAVHDRRGCGRSVASRPLGRHGGALGPGSPAAMGSGRVRRDRDVRARGADEQIRRANDPPRARHREHRLPGARQRQPPLRAGALPRARGQPRRSLLGGRRDFSGLHVPRGTGRRHAGGRGVVVAGEGRTWGDHIVDEDRAATLAAGRATVESGQDRSLDYRVATPDGTTVWVRDVVHVVRGAQGPRELRGLMVDITERKRAEQALRTSERKYSGLPAGAGGDAAPEEPGRDEEHVPGGRLARPPYPSRRSSGRP